MSKFDTYADSQGWTNAQKVDTMALFLKGPAELWFLEHHAISEPILLGSNSGFWPNLGVEANRGPAEKQLINRKQNRGETLEAYDLRSMCHRLRKPARDTVAAFIRGLLPEIKGQVAVLHPIP
jgi:hypothetical protein